MPRLRVVQDKLTDHRAKQVGLAHLKRKIMSANHQVPVATELATATRSDLSSIFAAFQLPEEIVPVPAMGKSFLVRGLTVEESADITQKSTKINKDGSVGLDFEKQRVWRLLYSIKDPATGRPLFNPAEHYFALKQSPADAWSAVEKVIRKFTGEDDKPDESGVSGSAAEAVFRE